MKRISILLIVLFTLFCSENVALAAVITLPNPLSANNITAVINNILAFLSGIAATLAAVMFAWAGLLYLTSAGNEGQLGKARKVLIYGVIGLGIALLGGLIITGVQYIIGGTPSS